MTNRKKNSFVNFNIISLVIIGIIGFLIRLFYFPYEIPLTDDALNYFRYASDINYLGHLPIDWTPPNNGWPSFVGLFFSILQLENTFSYMYAQRFLAIVLSLLTIVPIYFLGKKFWKPHYALVGSALFAFDPRIIQNSLLAITEPLFILLESISLLFFLSSNKKIIIVSFVLAAFATLVRAEGLFFFIAISIMFFVRYRNEKKSILEYTGILIIFVLIILPMAMYRMEINNGEDGIIQRVSFSLSDGVAIATDPKGPGFVSYALNTVEVFVKYLGWVLIPNFVFFVPIGFFLILKKRRFETYTIIVSSIVMTLPALAAYSIPALDHRYLYLLFPMFCVFSVFTVNKFLKGLAKQNVILILIVIGILLSSIIFLEFKKFDYEHEREALSITYHVVKMIGGVNSYHPESEYLKVVVMEKKWPVLSSSITEIPVIQTKGYESLIQYIKNSKEKGLTHLIVDNNENRPYFIKDVFNNEENYPYLIKEFDSKEYNYKYQVKVFKIDYEKFGS